VKIRPAKHADTAEIRRIVFSALVEYGIATDPAGLDADLNDVEANYIESGGAFEVVEAPNGRIVGTMGLLPRHDGTCELRRMYLSREVRGMGLGKTLMERALDSARSLGFRRIELETSDILVEAVGICKRFGFRRHKGDYADSRCNAAYALDLDPGAVEA